MQRPWSRDRPQLRNDCFNLRRALGRQGKNYNSGSSVTVDGRRRKKQVTILYPEILRLNFGNGGNKNQFHKAGEKYVTDFMSSLSSLKKYFADGGESRNLKIFWFFFLAFWFCFELKNRDFFSLLLQCLRHFSDK